MQFKTVEWKNNQVVLLDQRKLPTEETYVTCKTLEDVAVAIENMTVRGAPAIGVTAALGYALGALGLSTSDSQIFFKELENIRERLHKTRPTAVNLDWALKVMVDHAQSLASRNILEIQKSLVEKAKTILKEDIRLNEQMGQHGQALLNDGDTVLTHCNAGALATAGFGTALGVIYAAVKAGKKISVFADETRPFLQGARLTAWELHKNNVPVTLITDNMAGWILKQGLVQKIIVGADRIAANGDVANKIGTYSVAVLAKRHNVPFYVAAPKSTIDLDTQTGDGITIEERDWREVTHLQGVPVSPSGISIRNPAFDVTPNELVSGIITEYGIVEAPYTDNLKKLFL